MNKSSDLKAIYNVATEYDDLAKLLGIQLHKEDNKHLKGYMFDSLVYRYKLAREQMMQYELMIAKRDGNWRKEGNIRHIADRDVMRFINILDEAMGEHD